ncbi:Wzy polymerase domain-containing protein [Shewanella alkalitolerans]|uniref:PglL family O-oligosaccharyltransferase n=1 Tax=Shewanella alkalitolerans TaxID=2864209 RepID=UPI001C65A5A0|nr:Wzy polymerase domain-containing protein [Shewanella alkalitolerans]QYJ97296.1 Wzy polymerase domain-containing protein [Shewanella alkalitolerans]
MTTATQRYFYIVFALMFAVGMHYYQYNYGGLGLTIPANLVTWSFVSILIGLALWQCSKTNKIYYSKLLIATSICVLILFMPILYGNNELLKYSAQRLTGLIAGLVFLFSLYQINLAKSNLNQLVLWILAGVIVEGIICLVQEYVFIDQIWLQHPPEDRPYGIFKQPNVASTFFVMGIALSAYLLAYNKYKSKYYQPVICLASFLASWMVILNSSKTATISLFMVLALSAPTLYKRCGAKQLRMWYLSILIGLSVPMIINILDRGYSPRELVDNIRPTLYTISLLLISKNIFTGTGYGSFGISFHKAQADYIENHEFKANQFGYNAGHPHNELLLWGVEGGILPVLALLSLALFILRNYFSNGWRKGLFFTAIIFPAGFHTLTELPFYHSSIVFITFIFTLFLIEKTISPIEHKIRPGWLEFKITAITIPLATVIFMITGMQTLTKLHQFETSEFNDNKYLTEIVNPIAIVNGIEYAWFLQPLLHKKSDFTSIRYFISEVEALLKYWPRAKLYKELSDAYLLIGEKQLAIQAYQTGKRLFPYSHEFQSPPL